jgi:hypothetical protein
MRNLLIPLLLAIVNYSSSAGEISKDRATPITFVPYTISSPGIYYLANDITSKNPNALLTIASSNVVLDLQGHTLTVSTTDFCIRIVGGGGPLSGAISEIFFFRPGSALNVTVQNGTLINTIASCFFMGLTRACVIDHVTMIAAGQNSIVDDLGFFNRITNCNISASNPPTLENPELGGIYAAAAVVLIASGDLFQNNMVYSSWVHGDGLISVSHYNGGNISDAGNAYLNNVFWSFGNGSVGFDPLDANIGNVFLGPTK